MAFPIRASNGRHQIRQLLNSQYQPSGSSCHVTVWVESDRHATSGKTVHQEAPELQDIGTSTIIPSVTGLIPRFTRLRHSNCIVLFPFVKYPYEKRSEKRQEVINTDKSNRRGSLHHELKTFIRAWSVPQCCHSATECDVWSSQQEHKRCRHVRIGNTDASVEARVSTCGSLRL
jgi:hypothetical protein